MIDVETINNLTLEIQRDKIPKKIKVTTAFAEDLKAIIPPLPERPSRLPDGVVGRFPGITIEIDDEIDGRYEFVY